LKKVSEVPLPGPANRFDYQSLDPTTGRLYLSHMGAGHLVVFDTKAEKVKADLPGFATVTGVLAVPEEGKVYVSAAGAHEVVAVDSMSLKVEARIPGPDFPDGIAYVKGERRIFVSDESGEADYAIDCRTNKKLEKIPLGGEAGNTQYDPVANKAWVAVQTKNAMARIDPKTMKLEELIPLKGSEHPHGFFIDSVRRKAYITCEGNNKLLVASLGSMSVLQSFDLTHGPDVVKFDAGLNRLYIGCEGGAVEVFEAGKAGLTHLGKFEAPNAHTVEVDQRTHRVYVPLKNVGGKPQMWILEPTDSEIG
jgi:DNA-binding beta-propeller fold protein YncE